MSEGREGTPRWVVTPPVYTSSAGNPDFGVSQSLELNGADLLGGGQRGVGHSKLVFTRKRQFFGGALDFDKAPLAGDHEVHVHFAGRILVIVEVDQRLARLHSD